VQEAHSLTLTPSWTFEVAESMEERMVFEIQEVEAQHWPKERVKA